MRQPIIFVALFALCAFAAANRCDAQRTVIRDGSTEQKAIVVPPDISDAKAHAWQNAYLKKHFPEHFSLDQPLKDMGEEHAFIGHDKQRRWYDYYAFQIAGKKKEVYFDVSKQTWEWAKKRGLAK
jgi:hypothetical protein